ncbi:hypothetical protein [Pseudoalteromonas rubra]|uniref:hypothetical protein n=1 Tax=Pseudoalteromonas rubra TaxID=43658 RepID=UPI000F78AA7D|nr:hypothetical protein [Pseudoalteromonas rubra]
MPISLPSLPPHQLLRLSGLFQDYTGPACLFKSQHSESTTFDALGGHVITNGALTVTLLDRPVHMQAQAEQPATPWLSYQMSALLAGAAALPFQQVPNISGQADTQIQLAACLSTRPDAVIADTLIAHGAALPCIFSCEDVKALEPGESLSLDTQGTLLLNTSVKWSELLCQNFHLFSRWLGQGELLDLSFDANLTASLEVTVRGSHQVIFSRPVDAPHTLRLSYTKSGVHGTQSTTGAKITAQFRDSAAFQATYTAMVQAIFQHSAQDIEALTEKLSITPLPANLSPTVKALLKRLGLDRLEQLRPRITQIQQDLKTTIRKAAQSGAELSFYYQYNRIQTDQALVQLTVSDQALTLALHKAALSGKLLSQLHQHQAQINVEQFFNQRATQLNQSWGFQLNLFSWQAMSREDAEFRVTTTENAHGEVTLSGQGLRSYQDQVGDVKRRFYLDFAACMPTFRPPHLISMRDFELTLTLASTTQHASLDEKTACQLADELAIWRLIAPGEVDNVAKRLYQTLKNQQDVKLTQTLTLPGHVFRDLLPTLADASASRLAQALAAALPRHTQLPECRANPLVRCAFYAPAFEHYLSADQPKPDHVVESAITRLAQLRQYESAHKERDWRNKPGPTLGRMMQMHPTLKTDLDSLIKGMQQLNEDASLNGDPAVLKEIYQRFDDMGAQHFYVRFFAYYLQLSFAELGDEHSVLHTTGVIEFGPQATRQALLLKGTAPTRHAL